jgi:hypothetical protein
MGIRDRLRRLQTEATADRVGACSACGGRVTIIEYHDDGEASFPFEKPCELCEGDSGRVRFIEVMLGESDGD